MLLNFLHFILIFFVVNFEWLYQGLVTHGIHLKLQTFIQPKILRKTSSLIWINVGQTYCFVQNLITQVGV